VNIGAARRVGRVEVLPWLLVALVPIALALSSWDPTGVYNPVQAWFRLYGIAAIAAELALIGYSLASGTDPLRPVISLDLAARTGLLVLLAVGVFTALFVAPDWLRAANWTFFSIIHLLFGLAVAALVRKTSSETRLASWNAILAGVLGYFCIAIVFVALAMQRGSLKWEYFGLGVTNIRQVGFYSVVGAGAALGLAVVEARPGRQILYVFAAAFMLSLSFWSGTRGSLVAVLLAFATGTMILEAFRSIRSWLILGIAFAGGALISLAGPVPSPLYGVFRLKASIGAGAVDVSSGRFDMWAGAWNAILQRPVLGYGAGQYLHVVGDNPGVFNHPHNIVLQILLQWGFVGAACYFGLAMLLASRVFSALKNPHPADAPALLVGMSLLTMSLYEGALFHSYPSMMFAFALALIVAPRRRAAGIVP